MIILKQLTSENSNHSRKLLLNLAASLDRYNR